MSHADINFETTFTAERIGWILTAIKEAVNNASDQHDPLIGSNATTFGVNVYNFGMHELKKLATKYPKHFSYRVHGNLFRLLVDDFELAYHKVGYNVTEGIENSFPNNEGAIFRILEQQEEQLTFSGDEFDVQPKKQFVLAHFANPEDGISGLYLCNPKRDVNNVAWDVVYELWKSEQNVRKLAAMNSKPAPIEKLGELKLQPKENIAEISLPPKHEKVTILKDHE